jgi:hypothetical protein
MGNLGKYQDIVVDAKRAGGIDNLIAGIECNAVAKAAPRLLAAGAGGGALIVLATRWSMNYYGKWASRREAGAASAKSQLRAAVESATETDTAANQVSTSNDEIRRAGRIR